MVKIKIFIFILFLLKMVPINAQEFNANERYKQAMENAKMALTAKQYSQSVMFYREALSIKPNELLPKYKIEDIRTIYIKNELDSLIVNQLPSVVRKKKKKEVVAERVILKQKAEEEASKKMNLEAENAKKELKELTKFSEILDINDAVEIEEEELAVANEGSRVIADNKLEKIPINFIENKSMTTGETMVKPKKRTSDASYLKIKAQEVKAVKKVTPKPDSRYNAPKKVLSLLEPEVKNKEWIKHENGRLATKYPNSKTVEEIEKPGKHITRVVMNIDNKVTIYLKVKHSWGATFYFVDEVGLELGSISEIHFNRMTNLKTYNKE